MSKHLHRHQGENAAEHVPAETLGRERGARVAVVGVGKVVEGGEIDGVDAHGGAADGESGHDPRDRGELGPSEPEEAEGEEGRFETSEVETRFGGGEVDGATEAGGVFGLGAAGDEVVREDAVLVAGEDRGEDGADHHGGEDGVGVFEGEVVRGFEDEGDGAEGEVQHGPGECDPEGEEEYDGFGAEEVDGTPDGDTDHFGDGFSFFVGFDLPANALAFYRGRCCF